MTALVLTYLLTRIHELRHDLTRRRHDDAGSAAETVVVVGLLVVLAITAVGVISVKVLAKANSIDLNGTP